MNNCAWKKKHLSSYLRSRDKIVTSELRCLCRASDLMYALIGEKNRVKSSSRCHGINWLKTGRHELAVVCKAKSVNCYARAVDECNIVRHVWSVTLGHLANVDALAWKVSDLNLRRSLWIKSKRRTPGANFNSSFKNLPKIRYKAQVCQ